MDSDGVKPETPTPASTPANAPQPLIGVGSDVAPEQQVEYGPPMPPDYKQIAIIFLTLLVLSIPLSCCCMYLGGFGLPSIAGAACAMVALIQSGSVSHLYMAGDFDAAERMSARVRKWLIASVLVPFIIAFLMLAAVLIIAGISALVDHYQKNST